jgi:hypothetical protein
MVMNSSAHQVRVVQLLIGRQDQNQVNGMIDPQQDSGNSPARMSLRQATLL